MENGRAERWPLNDDPCLDRLEVRFVQTSSTDALTRYQENTITRCVAGQPLDMRTLRAVRLAYDDPPPPP